MDMFKFPSQETLLKNDITLQHNKILTMLCSRHKVSPRHEALL